MNRHQPRARPAIDDSLVPLSELEGPLDEEQLGRFRESGYLVIEDLIDDAELDRIVAATLPLYDNDVADGPRSRIRVQDAWQESEAVKQLACDERVLAILRQLYGREPIPFQTLNFQYGTQQGAHQDRMFFASLPSDFMCGVWVALEDVSLANGSLFYHPGSHRLPELWPDTEGVPPIHFAGEGGPDQNRARIEIEGRLDDLLEAQGFDIEVLEAKKGTLLIWAAGLAHGGSPIGEPGRTRYSQVTHYFFEDCLYTTPIYSNHSIGDLYLRSVVNVADGTQVQHRYGGLPVEHVTHNGYYKLSLATREDHRFVRAIDQMSDDAIENLIAARSSNSYRLGRMLTAPLRWLRSRSG